MYYRLPSLNFILNSGVSLYSSTVNGQFEFSVFEVQFNGTNSKCKMNMDIIANGQSGNQSLLGINLGSNFNGTAAYKGDFAEIIVYNQVFNNDEGDSISNYLMNKYAL